MHRPLTLSRILTLLLALTAAWIVPARAEAQVRIPAAALVDSAKLDDVMRQGEVLERERRWGEALSHYENALRSFPDRNELRQRVAVARTHLEIARRYADRSFLTSLSRLSEQQALDLYSEVLLKVETYHVSEPAWGRLVARGIMGLEIATAEPAFVNQHPQPVAAGEMESFSKQLRSAIDTSSIQNRHQAREAVAVAADIAARHLRISPQATVLEFTCAAAQSLDRYSAYLTGDELDEVFSQIEGNFVGLGIELKADKQSLLIVNVIPGGPAAQAGVRAGERIVEVDGKSMREVSTDTAADMLKGPEFSYVTMILQSPDNSTRHLRLQRRRVDVPSVQGTRILDATDGIGYMKLTSFQKTTSRDVDEALWSLHRQGMRALIIDVRGNPGGLLNASVEVSDKFLASGTIVSTRGRSAREDFDYKAHGVGTWRVPLVVLIDGDSASASEIFAGAIHDQHRGTIVGRRSYGKGSVQGIFPLSRYKAGIRLTTAKFFSPSGRPISHHGVAPDVAVSEVPRHVAARPDEKGHVPGTPTVDPALRTALEVAQRATHYQVGRTN